MENKTKETFLVKSKNLAKVLESILDVKAYKYKNEKRSATNNDEYIYVFLKDEDFIEAWNTIQNLRHKMKKKREFREKIGG